jgi:formylglycine-generating enzyme required for sulfatase activity
MYPYIASLILFCVIPVVAIRPASAVTIAWSPVGNPNNPADTTVMEDGTTGYGSVPNAYNIGTYDVTNSQYVEFLNSNDPSGANSLGLYNGNMSNDPFGGINYNSGAASGSKYGVISGDGNHPVTYETWYSAARFANWLDNGQTPGSTETGAYTLLGGTPTPSNANSISRNAGATIFLPSENEWYKAAYYNPATSSYFQYPTSSNTAPTGSSPTAAPNSANIRPGGPFYATDVGAYSGTTSPYGAYDMGGNVFQWNETLIDGSSRGVRGGSSEDDSTNLLSSYRIFDDDPTSEFPNFGFRVASVPEPGTAVLAVLGALALLAYRRRR